MAKRTPTPPFNQADIDQAQDDLDAAHARLREEAEPLETKKLQRTLDGED